MRGGRACRRAGSRSSQPTMLRRLLPVLGVLLVALPFAALGTAALVAAARSPGLQPGQIRLLGWGLASGEETKGLDAQLREFERRFPHIRVVNLGVGGNMALH